jgi:hypothetical protein
MLFCGSFVMLGVVMQNAAYDAFTLSVVMLSVVMLSVVMLSVVMLSVIMLSVVMLSVVMLSVVAPQYDVCGFFFHLLNLSKKY